MVESSLRFRLVPEVGGMSGAVGGSAGAGETKSEKHLKSMSTIMKDLLKPALAMFLTGKGGLLSGLSGIGSSISTAITTGLSALFSNPATWTILAGLLAAGITIKTIPEVLKDIESGEMDYGKTRDIDKTGTNLFDVLVKEQEAFWNPVGGPVFEIIKQAFGVGGKGIMDLILGDKGPNEYNPATGKTNQIRSRNIMTDTIKVTESKILTDEEYNQIMGDLNGTTRDLVDAHGILYDASNEELDMYYMLTGSKWEQVDVTNQLTTSSDAAAISVKNLYAAIDRQAASAKSASSGYTGTGGTAGQKAYDTAAAYRGGNTSAFTQAGYSSQDIGGGWTKWSPA